MTEEQAQRTRCCGPEGCGFTRKVKRADAPHDEIVVRFCLGSACMAWRHAPVSFTQVNDNGKTVQIEGRSYTDFYCGLAGKP